METYVQVWRVGSNDELKPATIETFPVPAHPLFLSNTPGMGETKVTSIPGITSHNRIYIEFDLAPIILFPFEFFG